MIATITRQQIGTVERALQIFLKLGLVEVLDSGTFYMSNIELLIGQSSTEAERKRAARLQNKALSAPRTNGGHLSDIRPPEIEIELELEKEIEIKREIKSSFEDAGSVEDTMLYTELEAAVHAMIQRLEYSFTFNPSLLTIPKRKQQVAEILKEAETYIWRIKEEMRCA